jgi:hypothetical protein
MLLSGAEAVVGVGGVDFGETEAAHHYYFGQRNRRWRGPRDHFEPGFFSPTSQPAIFTRSLGEEIINLLQKLDAEGATIVQVTRAENNSASGNRIIQLRDG